MTAFDPGEYKVFGTIQKGRYGWSISCKAAMHLTTGTVTPGGYFRPSNIDSWVNRGDVLTNGEVYEITLHRRGVHSSRIVRAENIKSGDSQDQARRENDRKAMERAVEDRQQQPMPPGSAPWQERPQSTNAELWETRDRTQDREIHAQYTQRCAVCGDWIHSADRERIVWNAGIRKSVHQRCFDDRVEPTPDPEPEPATPAVNETTIDKLVRYLSVRDHDGHHLNLALVGPAGCGKSTVARIAAERLGVAFYSDSFNRDTPPWQLTGQYKPLGNDTWDFVSTQFIQAYEHGGVYLADELDAADANTLLTLNMALANGHMNVPERHQDPVSRRHPDFQFIAAMNTFGHGADRVYAGREQLDEATLDRLTMITVDYDRQYENAFLDTLSPDAAMHLRKLRQDVRDTIDTAKLRRVLSTRRLIAWGALLNSGFTAQEVTGEFFSTWSENDRKALVTQHPGMRSYLPK